MLFTLCTRNSSTLYCEDGHSIFTTHLLHSFQRTSNQSLYFYRSGRGECVVLPLAGGEWYAVPRQNVVNSQLCVACLYRHHAIWVQCTRRLWLIEFHSGRGG